VTSSSFVVVVVVAVMVTVVGCADVVLVEIGANVVTWSRTSEQFEL
jgi:preprotein translocase subunit SecE